MMNTYVPTSSQEERDAQVTLIAEKLLRTTRQVTAKLSSLKIYVAKEYATKTGEKPVAKDSMADAIGNILGLTEPDRDSLAKANKRCLQAIFAALANSKPI